VNKKQYFMLWWALVSVTSVLQAIHGFINKEFPETFIFCVMNIFGIIVYGFILTMGLHFAQKIGAKLLFLDEDCNFKRDIFKPAILAAIIYATVRLLANGLLIKFTGGIAGVEVMGTVIEGHFLPLGMFFNATTTEIFPIFNAIVMELFQAINESVQFLLFLIAGLSLLLKKIIKDISTSKAMQISIFVCVVLSSFRLIASYGFSLFILVPLVGVIKGAVLGVLFWKKGFETAVLCNVIIVLILYLIAPAVVFAIGA
jgi:hypothetical protein